MCVFVFNYNIQPINQDITKKTRIQINRMKLICLEWCDLDANLVEKSEFMLHDKLNRDSKMKKR